jgi:hypothetical protein
MIAYEGGVGFLWVAMASKLWFEFEAITYTRKLQLAPSETPGSPSYMSKFVEQTISLACACS